MAVAGDTQPLTQLEFTPEDHRKAKRLAKRLGYFQYAYTSTSALYGLFCIRENPAHHIGPAHNGCIINTRELGMMFVQTLEDLGVE